MLPSLPGHGATNLPSPQQRPAVPASWSCLFPVLRVGCQSHQANSCPCDSTSIVLGSIPRPGASNWGKMWLIVFPNTDATGHQWKWPRQQQEPCPIGQGAWTWRLRRCSTAEPGRAQEVWEVQAETVYSVCSGGHAGLHSSVAACQHGCRIWGAGCWLTRWDVDLTWVLQGQVLGRGMSWQQASVAG